AAVLVGSNAKSSPNTAALPNYPSSKTLPLPNHSIQNGRPTGGPSAITRGGERNEERRRRRGRRRGGFVRRCGMRALEVVAAPGEDRRVPPARRRRRRGGGSASARDAVGAMQFGGDLSDIGDGFGGQA